MKESLRNVTLRQLQIFKVAAEYKSFARAAEILYLTQPAVSMQMKRLAEMIGVELFAKNGRDLKLTCAGQSLLPYVSKVTQTLREAGRELDAVNSYKQGQVNLGLVTTTQYFSPRLTTEFRRRHPTIELNITIANRRRIIEKLESNEVDIAIMGRTPKRLDVDATEFYDHPYVIIAPQSHPLAGQKNISPYQLRNETFFIREAGSGTRLILDHFFIENEITPPTIKGFSGNEAIKQGVMSGMGLSLISAHTIHLEQKSKLLSVLDVETMPVVRDWLILHLADKQLRDPIKTFKLFIKEEASEYLNDIFFNGN